MKFKKNKIFLREFLLGEWDADGQRADGYFSAISFDQKIFAVNATVQLALATVQKIQTIIFDVESDHIATFNFKSVHLKKENRKSTESIGME